MQIHQGFAYLQDPRKYLVCQQRPSRPVQLFLEILTFDVIHHQVLPLAWNHEMIDDARQVGVLQVAQDLGFTFELALGFRGNFQVLFHSPGTLQVNIPCPVNRPKAALPQ